MGSEDEDIVLSKLNKKTIVEYIPAIVYCCLVILCGILGNLASIAYYHFHAHQTTTNRLIAALATTDLIACIVFSDEIIELCFTITFKNVVGCKFMYFLNRWLAFSSVYILVAIGVDRYRRICRRKSWQISVKAANICICFGVVLSCVLSVRDFIILDVVQVNITLPDINNGSVTGYYCTHSKRKSLSSIITVFHFIDFALCVILFPVIIVVYIFVARVVWRQRKRTERGKETERPRNCDTDMNSEKEEISTCASSTFASISQSARNDSPESLKQGDNCKLNAKNTIIYIVRDDSLHTEHGKSSQHNNAHTHVGKIEHKIAIMMITVSAASILSFIPYFIINLVVKRGTETPEQEFNVGVQIALRSFMLNNAINPYIMGCFNTQFKLYIKTIVCRCLCCKQRFR